MALKRRSPTAINPLDDFRDALKRQRPCTHHGEIALCKSREEARLWWETIDACSPPKRLEHLRWFGQNDLFFLLVYMLNRKHLDTDFHFDRCREIVAEPNNHLDLWFRESGKSELMSFGQNIRDVLNNPDVTIGIFSHSRPMAKSFLRLIKVEFEQNELLKEVFPDILFKDPQKESPKWSEDDGITVRRRFSNRKESTLEAWGLIDGQPTSRRFCIGAGGLVYTSDGLVKIEDVRVGKRVLNREGRYTAVVAAGKTGTPERLLTVTMWGQPDPIHCTAEHRFLTWRDDGLRWVEARSLKKNDLLALPLPRAKGARGSGIISRTNKRINDILCSRRVWRLIGYWLAEGNHTSGNCVKLSFGKHEPEVYTDAVDIIANELGKPVTLHFRKGYGAVDVQFFDQDFKAICAMFGTHAWNKHIPPFALTRTYGCIRELILGYFRGDGSYVPSLTRWSATSVSRSLVAGIQQLLAIVHVPAVVMKGTEGGEKVVAGRLANTRPSFAVTTTSPTMCLLMGTPAKLSCRQQSRSTFIPGYMLTPIRSVGVASGRDVYDLQVRHGESFVVNGVCVHNSILHYDDVISRKEINTPEMVDRTTREFENSLALTASDPPKYRYLATYQEINDTTHQLVNRKFGPVRCYPAVDDNGMPVLFSEEKLAWFRERTSPKMFALQYLLDPVRASSDAQIGFSMDWLTYRKPSEMPEVQTLNIYMVVDPAGNGPHAVSKFALWVMGIDARGNWFALDAVHDRINLAQRADIVIEKLAKWKPLKLGYETYGMQSDVEYLRERFRTEGIICNLVPLGGTRSNQDDRIEALIPDFRMGKFILPAGGIYHVNSEGRRVNVIEEFVQHEYCLWPYGRQKDLFDAMSRVKDAKLNVTQPRAYGDSSFKVNDPWGTSASQSGSWMSE